MRTTLRGRPAALLATVALALAACDPARSTEPTPGAGEPAVTLQALACRATRAAVTCASPAGGADASRLLVGGQGIYVFLQGSNVQYLGGDDVWRADLTVQNLIPQALGTADGTTPDPAGVRVFFAQAPTATVGTGTIEVLGADTATFTASGQVFYQWDEVLSPNETSSPLTWEFSVPPTVSEFGFVVYVAAAVPFPDGWVDVSPAADTMLEGGTQALTATVRSVVGNAVPGQTVTWGTSDGAVATVSAGGTVTAAGMGAATITATAGARSGTARIVVAPQMAVGAMRTVDMPLGASFALGAGEYVVMPVNTAATGSLSLAFTGAGIVGVTGAPTPDRIGAARLSRTAGPRVRRPDDAFHARLRRTERALARDGLDALRRGPLRPSGGARRAITPGVPSVGALMSINVQTDDACSTFDLRTGRVMAVGTRAILLADTLNPAGGFTASDYQAFADDFDALIHPTVTGAFGSPADIDGNGRVVIFFTRAVNELTPPGSGSFTAGFFYFRDLLPAANCPTSNVGEMFYMLVPDPTGVVNGNDFSKAFVAGITASTLGHEYQHLINASRRIWINEADFLEDVWLDEGLAHVAEELMFYEVSGLAPRANLDVVDLADGDVIESAFFEFADANFARYREWLVDPRGAGPFEDQDGLATRGAAWAFLRYAADRRGGAETPFWNALVNTTDVGLANLQTVLGTDPRPWFRDFAAAVYADDATAGVAATFSHPSWNYRDVFDAIDYSGDGVPDGYPLAVRNPANGVTDGYAITSGGGAAYHRVGVPANAFAGIRLLSGGATPPATVRVALFRRK